MTIKISAHSVTSVRLGKVVAFDDRPENVFYTREISVFTEDMQVLNLSLFSDHADVLRFEVDSGDAA